MEKTFKIYTVKIHLKTTVTDSIRNYYVFSENIRTAISTTIFQFLEYLEKNYPKGNFFKASFDSCDGKIAIFSDIEIHLPSEELQTVVHFDRKRPTVAIISVQKKKEHTLSEIKKIIIGQPISTKEVTYVRIGQKSKDIYKHTEIWKRLGSYVL